MQRFFATFRQSKIQTRLVIYYVAFAIATVGAVIYFAYTQTLRSLEITVGDRLNIVAELKQASLNQWVSQQRRAVTLLAKTQLQPRIEQLFGQGASLAERETVRAEVTRQFKNIVENVTELEDIQVLDMNGQVLISTRPHLIGISEA